MGLPHRPVLPAIAAGVILGLLLGGVAAAPVATATPAAAVTGLADQGADDDNDAGPKDEDRTVDRAEKLLGASASGGDASPDEEDRPEATMTLVELFRSRPRLGFFDSLRAQTLLARPTEGGDDRTGDGFEQKPKRICNKRACVHYVTHGDDRTTRASARLTLRMMRRVWRHQVHYLGYAAPPTDGKRGGDGRFDVYLTDLGSRGLFGYCAPERRVKGDRARASSYCVLDNDFSRKQYDADPVTSLRVTAAHEFFHAVQFGYDVLEDPWLMESTATWLEERFANRANDNRRFLRHGSVRQPHISLDRSDNVGMSDYGNWAFWEHLTARHGDAIVRQIWRLAGARDGKDLHSVEALEWALERRGGLKRALRQYASANLDPARSYPEGTHWPRARIDRKRTLSSEQPRASAGYRIDHLAARHVRLAPDRTLRGDRWRLRVQVDGPDWRSAPAAVVLVRLRDGTVNRRRVALDRRGDGELRGIWFDASTVRDVVVTLVNASTRYRCGRSRHFACGGAPRDDRRPYRVVAHAVRR